MTKHEPTRIRLSELLTDPDVRAAFWRAEQDRLDRGAAFAVPARPQPPLEGCDALRIRELA